MIHSYSRFDQKNDSMELEFSSEVNADMILLTNGGKEFLTFAKSK
jgi:hypothetical protein